MSRRILTALALYALAPIASSSVSAQDVPLSDLLTNLIQAEIRLAPPAVGFSHEAHFIPGANQQIAPFFFNQQLTTQLGTFPIGSPSGGFSYMFDSSTGTFQRATETFGPAFADRALTIGTGRFSFGANFQYSKYTSFEGADLGEGEIKFYLRHQAIGGFSFEGDIIEAALDLDVSSSTTTLFGNYGLTNAWDVAVAVPIQRVSMDASIDATVLRLATGDSNPLHQFPNGTTQQTFTSSGSASGIGDVLLRTKYRFLSMGGGGLAVGLDVRLPTGDEENLLGTGETQTSITFIGSSTTGPLAPHFNFGYTFSSGPSSDPAELDPGEQPGLPNEFAYKIGTELFASPRVTVSADFIGRTLLNLQRMQFGQTDYSYIDPLGDPQTIQLTELNASTESLNLTSLAVGGKFNVTGNLLINANLLFALGSRGITAPVTPVVGFDYSF